MMCDVDLLVPKALIEDAIAALRSIGYVSALNYPAQEDLPFITMRRHSRRMGFQRSSCTGS